MPDATKQLNIAMIGSGSIARAHSNAFHQVGHFFETPYSLNLKVVCGRNQSKLEAFARLCRGAAGDKPRCCRHRGKLGEFVHVSSP